MAKHDWDYSTQPLTTFGRLELYTDSVSEELSISQHTSAGVSPDNCKPLCCKCGNANEFEVEVALCLTQQNMMTGKPNLAIASNHVYVRDVSITHCKCCGHIAPYHEFVARAAAQTDSPK